MEFLNFDLFMSDFGSLLHGKAHIGNDSFQMEAKIYPWNIEWLKVN